MYYVSLGSFSTTKMITAPVYASTGFLKILLACIAIDAALAICAFYDRLPSNVNNGQRSHEYRGSRYSAVP